MYSCFMKHGHKFRTGSFNKRVDSIQQIVISGLSNMKTVFPFPLNNNRPTRIVQESHNPNTEENKNSIILKNEWGYKKVTFKYTSYGQILCFLLYRPKLILSNSIVSSSSSRYQKYRYYFQYLESSLHASYAE